jgi:hypothetical protein
MNASGAAQSPAATLCDDNPYNGDVCFMTTSFDETTPRLKLTSGRATGV